MCVKSVNIWLAGRTAQYVCPWLFQVLCSPSSGRWLERAAVPKMLYAYIRACDGLAARNTPWAGFSPHPIPCQRYCMCHRRSIGASSGGHKNREIGSPNDESAGVQIERSCHQLSLRADFYFPRATARGGRVLRWLIKSLSAISWEATTQEQNHQCRITSPPSPVPHPPAKCLDISMHAICNCLRSTSAKHFPRTSSILID